MNLSREDLKYCSVCKEPNKPYSLSCESCGFDMDFIVEYNHWGIPKLIPRKKWKEYTALSLTVVEQQSSGM